MGPCHKDAGKETGKRKVINVTKREETVLAVATSPTDFVMEISSMLIL